MMTFSYIDRKVLSEFRCGSTSMSASDRSGCQIEIASPETIKKVNDLADRSWKVHMTAEAKNRF